MFRLLNKSAVWHLCQCVNHWLWNSSKSPFTVAVLQSSSRSNPPARPPATVDWSAQGTRAARQSVSRWYQLNFSRYSGAQVHLGDAHSKQWAALNASSLSAYLVDAFDNIYEAVADPKILKRGRAEDN